jgi:ABC-2 type transport system permease protein
MKTFFHLFYKDILLLIRDKAGLLLLFIMPLALVLIMTSMQDGVMSANMDTDISLIVLNDDGDSIGNTMQKKLKKSDVFNTQIAKEIDSSMTEDDLSKLIADGKYLVGIYIPDSTTEHLTENFKNKLENAFNGNPADSITNDKDSLFLKVYIDPVVKPSVHSTIMSNIREFSINVENQFSLKEISLMLDTLSGSRIKNPELSEIQGFTVKEKHTDKTGQEGVTPNSVQHNVPAWTLFAIFFIVVSFSGSIIKEREDGSFYRLMTMPCSFATYLSSKMALYLIVCIFQFLMVLAMGIWVFPLIDLEAFVIDGYFLKLLFVVVFASMAAIGYGTAISAMATSQQQAAIFGSVSVVILSAIGGIWIPTFAMPRFLKFLSHFSPLNWGMEASYDIILRKSPIIDVLPECMYLLLFAVVCFLVAVFYKKCKTC